MLGFFAAFMVKLGAAPLHTWLPDAHTEAPTAGSVILAGLLLKTGGYGMLRFVVPLFPQAAHRLAPIMMGVAVCGILYGALMAFAQTDLKRLVAYTSVSHMGFVLLGVFAWNALSTRGALVQMVAHGLSTGGLFFLVGALQERIRTRDISRMGGLWATAPRMAGVGLFLALASMAIPGTGNFIGEFLVLLGTWRVSIPLAAVAVLGIIASATYALRMVQVTFHGPNKEGWKIADCSARETAVSAALMIAIAWIGLYPKPVLGTAGLALDGMRETSAAAAAPAPPEAGFPPIEVKPEPASPSATTPGGRP
jgi:NADH-quinone oxidoreductase subunit M